MIEVDIQDYIPSEIPEEDRIEEQSFAGKKVVIAAGKIFVSKSLQYALSQAHDKLLEDKRSEIQNKNISRDEYLKNPRPYKPPLTSNCTKYLFGCDFSDADIEIHGPATMLECGLNGATINVNNGEKLMVVKADLANATMKGSLQDGWLTNISASKAAKIIANMQNSHITHSHLGNMHFSGNLTNTNIHSSNADSTTSFAGASFAGRLGINNCDIPQSSFAKAKGLNFVVISQNGVKSTPLNTQQADTSIIIPQQGKQH